MPFEAFTPAVGLEEMLIPHDTFEARRERMALPVYVGDIVAGERHEAGDALRP
jgi:hypothetical protein